MRRKGSREVAFCGVMAAMGSVLLLLGSLIPGATYCAPILGMLPLIPVISEFGQRPAFGVYAVTAALAALLIPDKELAGVYVFLGYYPALRPTLNRLRCRLVRMLCKLAVFNVSMAVLYFLLLYLMGLKELQAEFATYSRFLLLGLAVCGNFSFVLLDIAMERLSILWQYQLRSRFFRHDKN